MGITGKKVGLRWSGNQYYEANLSRTLPLDELNKVLDFNRTDVTFISVQREDNEALQDYPTIKHVHTETVEDLLAVLSLMDTTISSCTSIAHFAAAAGLNLHVCPPLSTYYTWLGTTKWYGENCHIHRQTKHKDYSHLNTITL